MHHSRLCALVIDCEGKNIGPAAEFWGRALGKGVEAPQPDPMFDSYRQLTTGNDETWILLQQVDHPSRVHLDIESDNLDAEAARLEALGAKRIKFVKRWWVMEAPTGHRFCIVNPQRGPLDDNNSNVWP